MTKLTIDYLITYLSSHKTKSVDEKIQKIITRFRCSDGLIWNSTIQCYTSSNNVPGKEILAVNLGGTCGQRLLGIAAQENDCEIARWLLKQGACVDLSNDVGHSPFFIAARNGHIQMMALLADAGANIEHRSVRTLHDFLGKIPDDWNALHASIRHGKIEAVQWLLSRHVTPQASHFELLDKLRQGVFQLTNKLSGRNEFIDEFLSVFSGRDPAVFPTLECIEAMIDCLRGCRPLKEMAFSNGVALGAIHDSCTLGQANNYIILLLGSYKLLKRLVMPDTKNLPEKTLVLHILEYLYGRLDMEKIGFSEVQRKAITRKKVVFLEELDAALDLNKKNAHTIQVESRNIFARHKFLAPSNHHDTKSVGTITCQQTRR